jgi:hypothetical protein
MIEFFAVGVVMALVTGGVTYALSQWFAQFIARPNGECVVGWVRR